MPQYLLGHLFSRPHSILTVLWVRGSDPHFTGEETESQGSFRTSPLYLCCRGPALECTTESSGLQELCLF